ncbi:MAG: glycosyltransferase family 2 protein [Candidatus Galacturonibacter soehngenii]|nr:glycosyltransferase family 2 protein [Candidatus Galacturonibacter soehngenii]
MIKVSIIVPIYNVEQYLERCLESLVNQTLKDIEIILVNDASPDRSDVIMKRYAEQYSNIKNIFLKENLCAGGARNKGIEQACGEYIAFVDGDDYIDLDFCEKMYLEAIKTSSDMAYGVFCIIDESDQILSEKLLYPVEFSGSITEGKKCGFINKGFFSCGKLFKTTIWKENKIEFAEGLKYEEAPTIPVFLMYAKKCCYVLESHYYYFKRSNSTMNSKNNMHHKDAQKTVLLLLEQMQRRGFYNDYKDAIDQCVVERYYSVYLRRCLSMFDEIPYDNIRSTQKNILEWYSNYKENKYYFTLVGEDRMRMGISEISPELAYVWEKSYCKQMINDIEVNKAWYLPFYQMNKDKITKCFEKFVPNNKIFVNGNKGKKDAFLFYISQEFPHIQCIDIKENRQEKIDCAIVVNPSACLGTMKLLKSKNIHVKVINLEDYLNDFILI